MTHPIEDPRVHEKVKEWTATVLARTGSGKILVEFDYHEGECRGVRLGGVAGREPLDKPGVRRVG